MVATRRLYREMPYCTEFDAAVVEQLTWDGRPGVILDATCFYATSGGQPCDLGTLAGASVVDVLEDNDRIIHILDGALDVNRVHGVIDWARRFDHMQQHTGQHILSGAFEMTLGAQTVSFHLGATSSTIDIARSALDTEEAARVEDLANRIVFENRAVSVREYDEAEIDQVPLRKAPVVHDKIRVVSVEEFDASACGGTHVSSTGEVGGIHILRWDRRRDQVRVEFVCGWRALRVRRAQNAICLSMAGDLSVGIDELPAAVTRLIEAERAARKEVESLRKRLLDYELHQLAAECRRLDGVQVLVRLLEGYDANNMRYVAQNLIQRTSTIVLLAVKEPSPQICFARSSDLNQDMARLFRDTVVPLGGRGGGKSHMAQGGGVEAEQLPHILEMAWQRLDDPS